MGVIDTLWIYEERRRKRWCLSQLAVMDACQLLRQRMFKVRGLRSPFHSNSQSYPKVPTLHNHNLSMQIFSNIKSMFWSGIQPFWPRHSSFRWKEGLSGFNINCFLSKLNKNVWVNWTWRVMQPKLPHSISTQIILLLQISRGKYKLPHRNFTQVL